MQKATQTWYALSFNPIQKQLGDNQTPNRSKDNSIRSQMQLTQIDPNEERTPVLAAAW